MAWDFGINPEIISGILNFRDWKFWDSGLLKLPGLGFSGFRIPEHQDFPGFPFFRDPEPLPKLKNNNEIERGVYFNFSKLRPFIRGRKG